MSLNAPDQQLSLLENIFQFYFLIHECLRLLQTEEFVSFLKENLNGYFSVRDFEDCIQLACPTNKELCEAFAAAHVPPKAYERLTISPARPSRLFRHIKAAKVGPMVLKNLAATMSEAYVRALSRAAAEFCRKKPLRPEREQDSSLHRELGGILILHYEEQGWNERRYEAQHYAEFRRIVALPPEASPQVPRVRIGQSYFRGLDPPAPLSTATSPEPGASSARASLSISSDDSLLDDDSLLRPPRVAPFQLKGSFQTCTISSVPEPTRASAPQPPPPLRLPGFSEVQLPHISSPAARAAEPRELVEFLQRKPWLTQVLRARGADGSVGRAALALYNEILGGSATRFDADALPSIAHTGGAAAARGAATEQDLDAIVLEFSDSEQEHVAQSTLLAEPLELEIERVAALLPALLGRPAASKTDLELRDEFRYVASTAGEALLARFRARTHYERLGLLRAGSRATPMFARQVKAAQVRARFRALSREFHPDTALKRGALFAHRQRHVCLLADVFSLINESYQTLADPARKEEYDRRLFGATRKPAPAPTSRRGFHGWGYR
eukprot:gnl/Chilomastix_cuspidata/4845.p1 GENE.gnl/Chilomastix_cuspidata/4845~~gnl/Chilomastix_cuspidata/4845.p1  ORF type:complete len:557 (+),score=198.74 gnl/Chilomastix_cuspidata/4845:86-1756(+)